MAFLIHSTDDGRACPWEYLPAGVITPKIGLALVLSSGTLTVASDDTKPTHICMTKADAAVTSGTIIPVIAVQADIIFETTFASDVDPDDADDLTLGDAVTLADDGLGVTAETTDGVFTLVEIVEPDAGGIVRGRFLPVAAAADSGEE